MMHSDDPSAIPLWINGHAYLTLAPAFHDVLSPHSGKVLRRTPLCGAREAQQAAGAAWAAASGWAARSQAERAALLDTLADALAGYAAHFAQLIVEESGIEALLADAEVSQAVGLLRGACASGAPGLAEVVAIAGATHAPLLDPLSRAVPQLLAGTVVIIAPSPQTPSAIFALAELTGRCAFPPGVFSIVHGGDAALDGLCAAGVSRLCA